MTLTIKAAGSIAATVAICGLAVVDAHAATEGHWASHWGGVLPGATSRKWIDSNSTDAHTKIAMKNCKYTTAYHGGFKKLHITLKYDNTWTPDENMGGGDYACAVPSWVTHDFGRVKKGGYYFKLDTINGTDWSDDAVDVGGIDVVY